MEILITLELIIKIISPVKKWLNFVSNTFIIVYKYVHYVRVANPPSCKALKKSIFVA